MIFDPKMSSVSQTKLKTFYITFIVIAISLLGSSSNKSSKSSIMLANNDRISFDLLDNVSTYISNFQFGTASEQSANIVSNLSYNDIKLYPDISKDFSNSKIDHFISFNQTHYGFLDYDFNGLAFYLGYFDLSVNKFLKEDSMYHSNGGRSLWGKCTNMVEFNSTLIVAVCLNQIFEKSTNLIDIISITRDNDKKIGISYTSATLATNFTALGEPTLKKWSVNATDDSLVLYDQISQDNQIDSDAKSLIMYRIEDVPANLEKAKLGKETNWNIIVFDLAKI